AIGGMAIDQEGNVYISDTNENRVRKVDAKTGVIRNYAGGGQDPDGSPATKVQLGGPWGLAINQDGDLYIAEIYSQQIRKVSAATGLITAVVGTGTAGNGGDGGPAAQAQLNGPQRLAIDRQNNLYVFEAYGFRIRKVSADGTIGTVAGIGSPGYAGDG